LIIGRTNIVCLLVFVFSLTGTAWCDSLVANWELNEGTGTYNVKWYDPVDGDWVDQGSQAFSAGDNTFTKPGNISAEAALYLAVE
jgi:hypothetical protein